MWLFPKTVDPHTLAFWINAALDKSRFRVLHSEPNCKLGSRWGLKMTCVRLRRAKPYCGAHAGPCVVTGRRHPVTTFLEGLDWVAFFHVLNNTLDRRRVECDVFTFNREAPGCSRYYLRLGRLRRVRYPYGFDRGGHWTQDDYDFQTCFADHCGRRAPPMLDAALARSGTPGLPCTTPRQEARMLRRPEYAEEYAR